MFAGWVHFEMPKGNNKKPKRANPILIISRIIKEPINA